MKKHKLLLFLDQLSVHKAKRVKKHLDTLGIKYIYNIEYSPWNAGIEYIHAKAKRFYKMKKLNEIINDNKTSIE